MANKKTCRLEVDFEVNGDMASCDERVYNHIRYMLHKMVTLSCGAIHSASIDSIYFYDQTGE